MKFTITVTDFRPRRSNTLRGFATVNIGERKLTLHDVLIHQHANGKRWVGLPAKPVIDSGGVAKRKADARSIMRRCSRSTAPPSAMPLARR